MVWLTCGAVVCLFSNVRCLVSQIHGMEWEEKDMVWRKDLCVGFGFYCFTRYMLLLTPHAPQLSLPFSLFIISINSFYIKLLYSSFLSCDLYSLVYSTSNESFGIFLFVTSIITLHII